jgi:hypothetical protein
MSGECSTTRLVLVYVTYVDYLTLLLLTRVLDFNRRKHAVQASAGYSFAAALFNGFRLTTGTMILSRFFIEAA